MAEFEKLNFFKLIQKAEFEFSVGNISQLPQITVPEVVFSGRSNVGKSTLINKILNRKMIAKVSSKPGKTITVNFFKIADKLRFVDLPGYGYAKVSFKEKLRWSKLVEFYFNSGRKIKLVIQLVDSRRGMSADDFKMLDYLKFKKLPFIVIMTKIDKLNKKELLKVKLQICEYFNTHKIDFPYMKDLFFSDLSEYKINQIRRVIFYPD